MWTMRLRRRSCLKERVKRLGSTFTIAKFVSRSWCIAMYELIGAESWIIFIFFATRRTTMPLCAIKAAARARLTRRTFRSRPCPLIVDITLDADRTHALMTLRFYMPRPEVERPGELVRLGRVHWSHSASRKGWKRNGREKTGGLAAFGMSISRFCLYRVSRSSLYRLSFRAIRRTLRWTVVEFLSTVSSSRYDVTTYVAVVDPAAFTGNKYCIYGGTRNGDLENYSFYDSWGCEGKF